ncbi:MAG TPA: hypothetical protein VN516_05220 [Candidatus Baltobacteraceae bacterium]|nr:hypothetical protein [Candidatus Baltobacteraceae bacterium]
MKGNRGFTRGFRPRAENLERIEYVERLGVLPEFINGLIEKYGRDELVKLKQKKARELQQRADELKEALDAPVP